MCGYRSQQFSFGDFQGETDTRFSLMEALIKSFLRMGSWFGILNLVLLLSLPLLTFFCLQKSTSCHLIQNPVALKAIKNYLNKKRSGSCYCFPFQAPTIPHEIYRRTCQSIINIKWAVMYSSRDTPCTTTTGLGNMRAEASDSSKAE